jgi:glycosyltransferase involved in cell wall biosynthesis
MKFAILSSGFEPRLERMQPYRTLLEMGRQLEAAGHETLLVSDGLSRLPEQDRVYGLPVRRVRSIQRYRGRKNLELQMAVREESPDLVLWHLGLSSFLHQSLDQPFFAPVLGIVASPVHPPHKILRLGLRKLSSNLDLVAVHLLGALTPGVLIRRALGPGGLRGLITLSEATRQYLVAKGAPAGRVWVVPPGVGDAWLDAPRSRKVRRQLRTELRLTDDDFVVTYFGSPAPVRGLFTMLEAASQVAPMHPQLRLLILSRRRADEWGRQAQRLHSRISRNGLNGRIRVVEGFLEEADLIRHIAASDAVCLPFELLPSDVPLSVLEAMALERGVITTTVASLPELVGTDRGFLVEPGQVSSLAEQLEEAARHPNLVEARGRRAREYVQTQRTWDEMGKVLEAAVREASHG